MAIKYLSIDAERIARMFDARTVKRVDVKTTNDVGNRLRSHLPGMHSDGVQTAWVTLQPDGRGAHLLSREDPVYVLRIQCAIPIAKQRTSPRRFRRKRGSAVGELNLRIPGDRRRCRAAVKDNAPHRGAAARPSREYEPRYAK